MKKIIALSIVLLAFGSGQVIYKAGGDVRLSPRLLNYQGYLTDTLGNPITNPSVSMIFSVYDAVSTGSQKWTETQPAVSVSKGIFHVLLGSVTPIPDSVFTNSADRWLELAVAGQTLAPRTRIVSAPYAYTATYSDTAQYSRSAASDNDWSFRISDGADTTLQMGGQWGLARSGNMLIGNRDSTHVNLGVACTTGATGGNYKYCTVGGGSYNTTKNAGATVGGGSYNDASGAYATVAGGNDNTASNSGASVGGGARNTASYYFTTVGGGEQNTASGWYATVGGGQDNAAIGYDATVGGGLRDTVRAVYGGVFSGFHNLAGNETADTAAVVCGGYDNATNGKYAFVGCGRTNTAGGAYATVGGGFDNDASGYYSVVAGGTGNTAIGTDATVGGGMANTASGSISTVGGGQANTASNSYATVGGGWCNLASGSDATVAGGSSNNASGDCATVAGGAADTAAADYSFATNYSTKVNSGHSNSAAFTTSHTNAANQVRAAAFSTGTIDFAMDHPDDPMNKILNQYGVSSDEVQSQYSGSVILDGSGRAVVNLPEYFDDINRNPRIQLTGVGTYEIYVAEEIVNNKFVIGGKPNTKVFWQVTAERTDIHAEIARIQTPVVQEKTGDMRGHSIDDDAMIGMYDDIKSKNPTLFVFKTDEGRDVHEQSKRLLELDLK